MCVYVQAFVSVYPCICTYCACVHTVHVYTLVHAKAFVCMHAYVHTVYLYILCMCTHLLMPVTCLGVNAPSCGKLPSQCCCACGSLLSLLGWGCFVCVCVGGGVYLFHILACSAVVLQSKRKGEETQIKRGIWCAGSGPAGWSNVDKCRDAWKWWWLSGWINQMYRPWNQTLVLFLLCSVQHYVQWNFNT